MNSTLLISKNSTTSKTKETDSTVSKNSRIEHFDLARGLAILFMIWIHVIDFYGRPLVQESSFGIVIEFLGRSPAAPVFMFIMGVFIANSSRLNITKGLQRAAWLFALGYLLNLGRGAIPMWISLELNLVTYEELGGYTPLKELLIGNILQFAALAFVICILFKHISANPKYLALAAATIAVLSPMVWDISSDWQALNMVTKLLWGNASQGEMFPLFPWLTYPLAGMAFGASYKNANNSKRFHTYTLWTGLTLLAAGHIITLTDIAFHTGEYLRGGPGALIWNTGFVLVWLYLCRAIVERVPSNHIFTLLFFWSKNVTVIYFLQWLIIGWGLLALGLQQLNLGATIAAMLSVLLLSDLMLRLLLKVKQRLQLYKKQHSR